MAFNLSLVTKELSPFEGDSWSALYEDLPSCWQCFCWGVQLSIFSAGLGAAVYVLLHYGCASRRRPAPTGPTGNAALLTPPRLPPRRRHASAPYPGSAEDWEAAHRGRPRPADLGAGTSPPTPEEALHNPEFPVPLASRSARWRPGLNAERDPGRQ